MVFDDTHFFLLAMARDRLIESAFLLATGMALYVILELRTSRRAKLETTCLNCGREGTVSKFGKCRHCGYLQKNPEESDDSNVDTHWGWPAAIRHPADFWKYAPMPLRWFRVLIILYAVMLLLHALGDDVVAP
jgi:hypothetical protein